MIQVRNIPGYEGIYEAHSDGTIWTCKGKTTFRTIHGKIQKRVWKQRQIKPKYGKRVRSTHSDERVELWKDKQHSTKLVSRLVASAFIPNPIGLPCVNHIDGNTLNNTPRNLEWCTYKHNQLHAFNTSLNKHVKPIVLVDERGRVHRLVSLNETDRFLGRRIGYTSNLLIKHPELKEIDGYKIAK